VHLWDWLRSPGLEATRGWTRGGNGSPAKATANQLGSSAGIYQATATGQLVHRESALRSVQNPLGHPVYEPFTLQTTIADRIVGIRRIGSMIHVMLGEA
jgi:hypothetical protein